MSPEDSKLVKKVIALVKERDAARRNKLFDRADAICAELRLLGVELVDKPGGTLVIHHLDQQKPTHLN